MAQVWISFDSWTLTAVGQRDGMLQMNGVGQDCDVAGNWSAQIGAFRALGGSFYAYGSGAGDYRRLRMNTYTMANGRVYARIVIDNNFGGIYARGQDTADQDNYFVIARVDTDQLQVWRTDNNAITSLAATANNYTSNDILDLMVSCDAGGISAVDQTNNVTVGRVAETTYTAAGYAGVWGSNLGTSHTSVDWLYIYSSLNSGTAISTTLDAGSSVQYNGLCADVSAGGGSVTFDVRASDAAAGPHTTIDAGLTMTNGAAAFGAARTYQYWQTQANFTRSNSTQNVGIRVGSVRLANGFSASGGGTTNVFLRHGTSGGGESRARTRTVVVTDSQARRIIRAARKPYPAI